jgi:AraC family transcriptional regulator
MSNSDASLCDYPVVEPEAPLPRTEILEEIPDTNQLSTNEMRKYQAPGVRVTEVTHQPFAQTPLHLHHCPIIYLLLDGSMSKCFGNCSRDYQRNDAIYVPPEVPHFEHFRDKGDRGIKIEIVPDLVKQAVGLDSLPPYFLTLHRTSFALASRILAELRHVDRYSPSVIQALSVELLVDVCRVPEDEILGKNFPAWLKRVTDQLAADVGDGKVSLRNLAMEAGVHPVSVARAFRRLHGCTLGEFVRMKKIQAACDKLRHSRLTIGEIAREGGFSDQSHFTRCFRKIMGLSPGTYRKLI